MKLSLAEGLYLIALDDEQGRLLTPAENTYIDGVIAAAILELYLKKKITLKNTVIKVIDPSGTGNGILDKVLLKLHSGQRLTDEIENLHDFFKYIKVDLEEFLVMRGILRKEATKLLWIPLSERMDNANYAFEQEIRNVLKSIVLNGLKPTSGFVILLSLIYDCGVLQEVFADKDELIDAVKYTKDMIFSSDIDPELALCLKELKLFFKK
jgi:hypothetical protein